MTLTTETGLEQLTGTWEIDPGHSSLEFAAKHALVTTVRGRFSDFTGTLNLDGSNPERSSAEVSVQLASVDSRSAQRDEHLRGPDFFDVEKFPTMTFRSTGAELGDEPGSYVLTGDLTIRGVTREVRLDVAYNGSATDPWGNLRAGFEGKATINRKDWGLNWNAALEAGGFLVSDKIKLNLDIAAVKQS